MQNIGFRCRGDVADTEEAYTEYEEDFGRRAISLAGINTALLQHYYYMCVCPNNSVTRK